jgi:hypothetical protein
MRSRVFVIVLVLAPACLFPDLSALSSDAGVDAPVDSPVVVDASDGGDAAEAAPPMCDPAKPFSSIKPIAELDDSDSQYKATLTPDELDIWYGSGEASDAGTITHIRHAKRASLGQPFGASVVEAAIAPDDVDPAITDDGLAMYYSKFGTIGGWDLFETTRATTNDTFGIGFQLPTPINTSASETAAFVAFDKSLWFLSQESGTNKVWRAPFVDGGLGAPALVSSLASPAQEDGVVVTHDGLWAYVSSNRTDIATAGNYDIFLAHRATTSGDFGTPANVTEVNSAEYDRPNWISWDNCRFYFESFRNGSDDLFVATKTP